MSPHRGLSLTQQDAVSVEVVVRRYSHASSNDAPNSIDLTQPRTLAAAVNPKGLILRSSGFAMGAA
jgi:hypothetical protein